MKTVAGTALTISASYGNTVNVRALLDAGADVWIRHDGLTAIEHARVGGHAEIVDLIAAIEPATLEHAVEQGRDAGTAQSANPMASPLAGMHGKVGQIGRAHV